MTHTEVDQALRLVSRFESRFPRLVEEVVAWGDEQGIHPDLVRLTIIGECLLVAARIWHDQEPDNMPGFEHLAKTAFDMITMDSKTLQ
jgi:hypothetical protein